MTKIKIIKNNDVYAYKYDIIENNKTIYITKSGFKTLEEALKEAKKSYNRRINRIQNPTHVTKQVNKKEKSKKL